MNDIPKDIFWLLALLIVAAYFVGVSTDANSLANGILKIVLAISGRNSQGQFAAYPSGATQVQGG